MRNADVVAAIFAAACIVMALLLASIPNEPAATPVPFPFKKNSDYATLFSLQTYEIADKITFTNPEGGCLPLALIDDDDHVGKYWNWLDYQLLANCQGYSTGSKDGRYRRDFEDEKNEQLWDDVCYHIWKTSHEVRFTTMEPMLVHMAQQLGAGESPELRALRIRLLRH